MAPTGGNASQVLSGSAGTHYSSFLVDPLLSAPAAIVPRPYSGSAEICSDGLTHTVSPSLVGGEWIFRSDELKVENSSTLIFDISMVPNGQVAHFDVGKVIMETGGTIRIDDGGVTDAVVKLYAENEFKVAGGSLINPSLSPDRFKLFCYNNDMKLEVLSAAYVVAHGNKDVILENGSAVFGSVAGNMVKLQDGSAVHFDQALVGSGTGGSSLTLLNFQML